MSTVRRMPTTGGSLIASQSIRTSAARSAARNTPQRATSTEDHLPANAGGPVAVTGGDCAWFAKRRRYRETRHVHAEAA